MNLDEKLYCIHLKHTFQYYKQITDINGNKTNFNTGHDQVNAASIATTHPLLKPETEFNIILYIFIRNKTKMIISIKTVTMPGHIIDNSDITH